MFTEKFYEDMGKTVRDVAFDVWAFGELVQERHGQWNRAYLLEQHPEFAYLFEHPMLIADIYFENKDGMIWGIRNLKWHDVKKLERRLMLDVNDIWASGKKDGRWRWVRVWMERFGRYYADRAINERYNELLSEWRAYYAPPALPEVKRAYDTAWMEEMSTQDVAHRWAVATLMNSWYFGLQLNSFSLSNDIWLWMRAVWAEQMALYKSELEYRTAAQPKERSSKKKTEAAKRDFRAANEALVNGMGAFFSDDFVEMVRGTAFPFNVANLDYERLPEAAPENKPIRWMSDGELVRDFMRFLDADFDKDSFEYEDRELLLDNLRKQYARIMGQKVDA